MIRWLDFSGAPPLLIPKRLVGHWRGAISPLTGKYSELNAKEPHTDYDRACAAAWPGRGVLPLAESTALVLYSEFDEHTWVQDRALVACGSWLPTDEELQCAVWSDPLTWEVSDTDFLLMNSAASGAEGLRDDDFLEVHLSPGKYIIEYSSIEATYVGCFHRFQRTGAVPSAA